MKPSSFVKKIKYKLQYFYHIVINFFLVKKYPWLDCGANLSFTWYDQIPLGWRKAFGGRLLLEINNQIIKDNLDGFSIVEIKEKWGGLRIYVDGGSEGVYNIINKYENESYSICIECGKKAEWISNGYILPYCDKCAKKVFNKEEKWYKAHITNYTKKPFENYYSKVDKGE